LQYDVFSTVSGVPVLPTRTLSVGDSAFYEVGDTVKVPWDGGWDTYTVTALGAGTLKLDVDMLHAYSVDTPVYIARQGVAGDEVYAEFTGIVWDEGAVGSNSVDIVVRDIDGTSYTIQKGYFVGDDVLGSSDDVVVIHRTGLNYPTLITAPDTITEELDVVDSIDWAHEGFASDFDWVSAVPLVDAVSWGVAYTEPKNVLSLTMTFSALSEGASRTKSFLVSELLPLFEPVP